MAKPNYSFAKRQREIAKQKKKEEKLQEKNQRKGLNKGPAQDDETANSPVTAGTPAAADDGAGIT